MIFNSFIFIIFLLIVVAGYYLLPFKFKWIFLLLMSCWFYMAWNPKYIILMFITVFSCYISALLIHKSKTKKQKNLFLILALVISFGLLFIFKYSVFFNNSLIAIFNKLNINYPINRFDIILPMGISFYTFQAISYTIDIYRNQSKLETNFFKFALFIIFFPQLVAGPIERTEDLMPQIFKQHKFDLNNFIIGGKYLILGFFKKIVIADRISILVNTVYNSPTNFEGLSLIFATVLFSFQIYCDFCGYSEIAKGCAKLLGIDLMENFKSPYFSKSIREFWRRWHISLSTWFRDYIYIPLGGNRVSRPRKYFNTMITFLTSGLWHGADWTFVIWGGLHGALQILEEIFITPLDNFLKKLKIENSFIVKFLKTIITFTIICFTWIFFRANSFSDSIYIIKNLFTGINNWSDPQYIYTSINNLGLNIFEILISVGSILILIISELFSKDENINFVLDKKPIIVRFAFYCILTILIFSLGVFYDAGAFIYFQF